MPELPEVETWRRLAEQTSIGKTVLRIRLANDPIVFDQDSASKIRRRLTGRRIESTGRKGKHMWLEFDAGDSLYLHYGMSGSLHALPANEPLPSHWKLSLHLDNETQLVYRCIRRIGRIRLMTAPLSTPPIAQLGPDPFNQPIVPTELHDRLRKRKSPIKSLLLDQKVLAGIGNWLADDILYAARLNPHRQGSSLSLQEVRELIRHSKRILNTAVEAQADETRFPKTWLFHPRWDRKASHSARGERLQYDRIGGRTTVWAPERQK